MDTYGLAGDAARRKQWEDLLAELELVRDAYERETTGRLGMGFAAMYGILATLCTIARLHGQGVTSVMTFSPPSDDRGTDGRLVITLIGGCL